MKSPAAFARLGISDQIKELYRMVRQALAASSTPSEPSGPTIPTPPTTGIHILKSVEGVLQWEDEGAV